MERAQFGLDVGADGLRSAMRRLAYPRIEPAYRSFCAWRTVLDYADGDAVFRIRSLPGSLLGNFQVGPALLYALPAGALRDGPVFSAR